ncbi:MAG: 30S ribosomal protein S27ae [Candidatus Thorarchaeota archaeon]
MTDASKYYKIEGGKLIRTHRQCPKCGTGFFLADHYDRWSCGRCAYTVFKRKGKKTASTRRRSPRKRVKSQ